MRLQLALNVENLEESVDFYTKMFATPPLKTKPGYANFAIENPPLKLVLFELAGVEGAAVGGSINHLGVETDTSDEVVDAEARLSASGLETTGIDDTQCCWAEKTETWVNAPDGNRWEWYVKRADVDSPENFIISSHSDAGKSSEETGQRTCC